MAMPRGIWLALVLVTTISTVAVLGLAPAVASSASAIGARSWGFPAKTDLTGRIVQSIFAKGLKTYRADTMVQITCQDVGGLAYGTAIWDKTVDNLWVTDGYVETGRDGFVPGIPRCDGTPQPSGTGVARLISAAKYQTGLPYSWGGGNKHGASTGVPGSPGGYDDTTRVGFDCSGLLLYAVYQATGILLNHYTAYQYDDSRGIKVPVAQAQPGDAIFWSKDPDRATANAHVAIYLGNNQVVEALDHQHRVGIHWLRGDSPGRYRMPYAVRFVR